MVSKTLVLSVSFVACGLLMLAYGLTVAYSIAEHPKGPSFYWDYVPTYARFESISGGLPLVSLGMTLSVAGTLMGLHDRNIRSGSRRPVVVS